MLSSSAKKTVIVHLIEYGDKIKHTGVDEVSIGDGMYSIYMGDRVYRYSVYNIRSIKECTEEGLGQSVTYL